MQRQQTRWAVYGFGMAILAFLLLSIGDHAFSWHRTLNPFLTLVINPAYYVIMLLIPVAISVAILRSRLWDIDALINRTLVYGLLTAILALFYIGLIVSERGKGTLICLKMSTLTGVHGYPDAKGRCLPFGIKGTFS
jgi:hypothetical protein